MQVMWKHCIFSDTMIGPANGATFNGVTGAKTSREVDKICFANESNWTQMIWFKASAFQVQYPIER